MKYLKLFESYYDEVEHDYLSKEEDRYYKADTFSNKEFEEIENIVNKCGYKLGHSLRRPANDCHSIIYFKYNLTYAVVANIKKLTDDYYLIQYTGDVAYRTKGITTKYFKCDQLDGLLKNIEDNLQNTLRYRK